MRRQIGRNTLSSFNKPAAKAGHSLRLALLASCVSVGFIGAPAMAQDAPAAAEEEAAPQEAIVITGSRIVRRDYSANSPILTAPKELLTNSGTSALEQNLNKLPQFSPAQTPALGGDIQPNATNTPGAATISLRGIGANRSLVLIDGRRATPGNASMAVDINTIPAAAVERVEIISGGASSTYGADAVAGVTNFILKKNFQGLQLNSQIGLSERGDGREYSIDGIMGTDFADGKGNISIAFSTVDRASSYRRDRPWFQSFMKNNTINGTEFFPSAPFYTPGTNAPSQAALNTMFSGRNTTTYPNYPTNATIFFNDSGTAFSGFTGASGTPAGSYRFEGDLTGLKYKQLTNGALYSNFLNEYLNFPINRFNFFARGNYEINDWVSVFAQGYFNKTSTSTVQQPAPSANGWSVNVPLDGRAIPTEFATLLASRANPTAGYQLNTYLDFIGDRANSSDVYTYSMMAGLQGKVPGTDWTWEVYGSQGESETSALQTGFASLQRYRTILTAPNWGQGFSATGNAAQGGFGGATATCTSGLNPFNANLVVSQDCIDAIRADIKTRSVMSQTVWEGTAQGKVLTLPAGDLRASVGATYRQNRFVFQNDTLTTQGTSFIDQAVGLYPSGNSKGTITVKELYGELLVPVVKDLPLIKEFNLELGIRTSDYNTTGSVTTWKALGDWAINDFIRIRGGFNKAVRAPNIAELFLAPQQTFAVASGGDLCSLNNPLPYSAGTGNTTNRAAVQALCATIMNREDPSGQTSVNFYSNAAAQGAGSAFVFPTLQGNANIKPESAETWTVGTVISSPFESPLLNRMRLTVDYYNIKVTDAIGAQSADIIQRQCFDAAFNPTLSASSPYCQSVFRNVTVGTVGNLVGTYLNNGAFKTSGIDAQFDWSLDAGPGRFTLNSVFNYLIEMKSSELAGVVAPVDFAGTLGGNGINGLNGGFYRWKLFNTFSYAVGPATISLQWQHLPSIRSATYALNQKTTVRGAPAYDVFNLSGNVKVTKDASIRLGVDNLFDKAPPLTEVNSLPPAGTVAGGAVGGSAAGNLMYDILGRRYYIGATFKF
jgi:outer membrane receptor protein involved in Fe transport